MVIMRCIILQGLLILAFGIAFSADTLPSAADRAFQQKDYATYLAAAVTELKAKTAPKLTFDRLVMLTIALEQTKGWTTRWQMDEWELRALKTLRGQRVVAGHVANNQ